jgi:hypothetical protein
MRLLIGISGALFSSPPSTPSCSLSPCICVRVVRWPVVEVSAEREQQQKARTSSIRGVGLGCSLVFFLNVARLIWRIRQMAR